MLSLLEGHLGFGFTFVEAINGIPGIMESGRIVFFKELCRERKKERERESERGREGESERVRE